MFGELSEVVTELKAISGQLRDIVTVLKGIEELLGAIPTCNCGQHTQVSDSWACPIHGWTTKVTY